MPLGVRLCRADHILAPHGVGTEYGGPRLVALAAQIAVVNVSPGKGEVVLTEVANVRDIAAAANRHVAPDAIGWQWGSRCLRIGVCTHGRRTQRECRPIAKYTSQSCRCH